MGNPESQLREASSAMFNCAERLVLFFLFLTACIILFCDFALVPNFKSGITIAESLAVKHSFFRSDPRGAFGALSRRAWRALIFGHNDVQQISSLAFGGRGVGLLHA